MEMKLISSDKDRQIKDPPVIVSVMQNMLKRDDFPIDQREHFWIVGLDNDNKLKFIEMVAMGDRNQVNMSSADVFRVALVKNAARIILVHNHPSGNLTPSYEDKHTTLCLVRLAEMVGLLVIDHIIISADDYFSFNDEGLLDEIRLSDEYRLLDRPKFDQLKSDLKQAGKMEAILQEKLVMAKKMVEYDLDRELIIKITDIDPELV